MKTNINDLPKATQAAILDLIHRDRLRQFCVKRGIRRGRDKKGTIANIIKSGRKLTIRARLKV